MSIGFFLHTRQSSEPSACPTSLNLLAVDVVTPLFCRCGEYDIEPVRNFAKDMCEEAIEWHLGSQPHAPAFANASPAELPLPHPARTVLQLDLHRTATITLGNRKKWATSENQGGDQGPCSTHGRAELDGCLLGVRFVSCLSLCKS